MLATTHFETKHQMCAHQAIVEAFGKSTEFKELCVHANTAFNSCAKTNTICYAFEETEGEPFRSFSSNENKLMRFKVDKTVFIFSQN